jgi:hypothetical protein
MSNTGRPRGIAVCWWLGSRGNPSARSCEAAVVGVVPRGRGDRHRGKTGEDGPAIDACAIVTGSYSGIGAFS